MRELAGTPPVRILAALMVSRASWIARRHRAIHGEPRSSGREAMVPAARRQDGCRLSTALELRRSTNRAARFRAGGVPRRGCQCWIRLESTEAV
jgi:hypothetical protein